MKDYREKELKIFAMGNILVILIGTGLIDNIICSLNKSDVWGAVAGLLNSSVLTTFVYIYVFVLDSIVASKLKDRIIWPEKEIPGGRIFAEIDQAKVYRDNRFSKEEARKKYPDLFIKLSEAQNKNERFIIQNSYWYKLYKKHEKVGQVYVSQRDFLMCRDMTSMMIWILVLAAILSVFLGIGIVIGLWLFLIIEFVIVWIAARKKSERFVLNVIATDIAELKNESELT